MMLDFSIINLHIKPRFGFLTFPVKKSLKYLSQLCNYSTNSP